MGRIWTGKNDGLGVLILNLKKMWPKVLQEQGKIKPGDNGDDDDDESFGAGRKKFGVRPLAGKQTLSPAEVSPADQKVEADMIKLNTRVEVKKPGKVFVWSYSKLKRIPETFIIYQLHSQDALMLGGNTIQMKKIFVSNHILCK